MTSKHFISKKEAKKLWDEMAKFGIDINGENIEVASQKNTSAYFIAGRPMIFDTGMLIPSVYLLNYRNPGKNIVTIDEGAEPHILNGSDLFAPGITAMDEGIRKNDKVFIRSSKGYFIAVGIAERDASDIMKDKKGKAVRIIHYPDDELMKGFS